MFSNTVTQSTDTSTVPEGGTSGVLLLPDRYVPNANEVDAAQKYAGYETRFIFEARDVGPDQTAADGHTYRWAGSVHIYDDRRRFTVFVRKGAHQADVDLLKRVITNVKAGHRNGYPWRTIASAKLPGTSFEYMLPGDLSGRTLGPAVVPCYEAGCELSGDYHLDSGVGVVHWGESADRSGYRVQLRKVEGEPWGIAIDGGEALSTRAAADLANDMAWLRATAEQMNAKENTDE